MKREEEREGRERERLWEMLMNSEGLEHSHMVSAKQPPTSALLAPGTEWGGGAGGQGGWGSGFGGLRARDQSWTTPITKQQYIMQQLCHCIENKLFLDWF